MNRRDRCLWTFALAIPMVGMAGLLITQAGGFQKDSSKIPVDVYATIKAHWHPHSLDVVLAGDSRIYRGVSPKAMSETLPGLRVGNFGFSSVALAEPYLSRVG